MSLTKIAAELVRRGEDDLAEELLTASNQVEAQGAELGRALSALGDAISSLDSAGSNLRRGGEARFALETEQMMKRLFEIKREVSKRAK
jgi:phage shock protein A